MMYELLCGKINEENYQRDKASYTGGMNTVSPYAVLSDYFEFTGPDWISVTQKSEDFFGNQTWMDWGSFFCRGSYEQMKRFLEWGRVDDDVMHAFMSLPPDGDYGFVFIEDY